MPSINQAYFVLSEPSRRAVYDAELRGASPSTASSSQTPTAEPPPPQPEPAPTPYPGPMSVTRDLRPARVPWRMLIAATIVGVVGVVLLAQFTDPGDPPAPDGILRVGDCVEYEADDDAREVRCVGAGDLVVRAFVPFEGTCPAGSEPHRDRLGMGVACVSPRRESTN